MSPLTLQEIEGWAMEAAGLCLRDLARPLSREVLAVYWMVVFFARWSTIRHLRDLVVIRQDTEALERIRERTSAEEAFLLWLRSEAVRHEQAIQADEGILAKVDRAAGSSLVRGAAEAADRLAVDRRIQIEGGSPLPKEG